MDFLFFYPKYLFTQNILRYHYKIVKEKLTDMGFKNINTEKVADLKFGILSSEGDVKEVTINGDNDFKKDDYFDEQSIIKIYYHVFDK